MTIGMDESRDDYFIATCNTETSEGPSVPVGGDIFTQRITIQGNGAGHLLPLGAALLAALAMVVGAAML